MERRNRNGLAIENDRVTKRKALAARQRLVQQLVGPESRERVSQLDKSGEG